LEEEEEEEEEEGSDKDRFLAEPGDHRKTAS